MSAPRIQGQELVDRYRANYGIPHDVVVTEEMVMRHWELERKLTSELLASAREERWDVFERCYTDLYSQIDWLNQPLDADGGSAPEVFSDWESLLGDPPIRVYEVGSGKGAMIAHLARRGYLSRGTEITRERGESLGVSHPNLSWGITDGVNLDRFEDPASYDAVISDQVIEHLHPDDLVDHFKGALSILKPGGRYIYSTPHQSFGPWDLSRVFGYEQPMGMHLKEYSYRQIIRAARQAGFASTKAVLRLPRRMRKLGWRPPPKPSAAYTVYVTLVESLLGLLPSQRVRRRAAEVSRYFLFDGIFAVSEKES